MTVQNSVFRQILPPGQPVLILRRKVVSSGNEARERLSPRVQRGRDGLILVRPFF